MKKAVFCMFMMSINFMALSQEKSIVGKIQDENFNPLPGALIQLEPSGKNIISDKEGNFRFKNTGDILAPRIIVSFLGYTTMDTLIGAVDDAVYLELQLQKRSLDLQEVIVTAQENRAGLGTSSTIERSAIEHVQPNSLRDVLQLIPGQLAINPSLSSPQQILLRQVPTDASSNAVAQMGTALIMDGSPVSNDANMQFNVNILNSGPNTSPPFQSVSGQGFDLRQIPADQIESVEVLRGIPSARHGNFTNGAIIVNTRVGAFDPNVRIRANPTILQASAGSGFSFHQDRHAVSFDLDFADATPDPRDVLNHFTRLTGNVANRMVFPAAALTITNRLGINRNIATRRKDADNDPSQRSWESKDASFRFNSNLRWQPEEFIFDVMEANITAQYSQQRSYFNEFITTNVGPRPIFMIDTTAAVPYGTARYYNQTSVEGNPLNIYGRLEGSKSISLWGNSHRLLTGMEYRLDANHGAGRQFDLVTPPRQNYNAGDRPRKFDNIPTLNQLSLYAEDRFTFQISSLPWHWQLGMRYDHAFLSGPEQRKVSADLLPRINTAIDVLPFLSVRAGYGITSKVPALRFLSPGPRFIDLINFNYYAPDPAERLLIVTTRRIDIDTRSLSPFKSEKIELGIEGSVGKTNYVITYFKEATRGGPSLIREPYLAARGLYDVLSSPAGMPPTLTAQPARYDTLFTAYDRPVNNQDIINSGLEYMINLPEWKALRTSLNFSGSLIRTNGFVNGEQANPNFIFEHIQADHIPFYQAGQGYRTLQWNTSFRFIHRIPEAGLVISTLAQTVWVNRDRMTGFNPYPTALLNRKGEITRLSPEAAASPENELYWNRISDLLLLEEKRPPLWLFNLRVNKEFEKGRGFAFYVNNFFNNRPLYQNKRSNTYTQRNIDLFFGAEIFYQL
ncbi:outer membrane receptor protein [Anditalea andensis]|uniref:Outer membrane receptor protein n=2 Tax=Anditalea andensis TaxID=1048983 RepID=A0A074KZS4_9BACT|nr:outer membrane receptor protein [Anditalea andensis]